MKVDRSFYHIVPKSIVQRVIDTDIPMTSVDPTGELAPVSRGLGI